jgi:hypothetical protein
MRITIHLHSAFVLLSILISVILSGCASTNEAEKNAEMLRQNIALQEKNTQLTTELASQSALAVTLQMKLIEKHAEMNRLSSMQQPGVGREVGRNTVKIRVPANKAEAVAFLAEVATDVDSAREVAGSSDQQKSLTKADQFMAESKVELERGNFDRACVLVGQALDLIQTMQLQTIPAGNPPKSYFTAFLTPLSMQVSRRSNIRKHPDIHAQILDILDLGTQVKATGYQGRWVRVTFSEQQIGWIHYSLLTVPDI